MPPVNSVITITGIGDHLQPEWLITFTGIRTGGELWPEVGTTLFADDPEAARDHGSEGPTK
jgi:hypothetical protein